MIISYIPLLFIILFSIFRNLKKKKMIPLREYIKKRQHKRQKCMICRICRIDTRQL